MPRVQPVSARLVPEHRLPDQRINLTAEEIVHISTNHCRFEPEGRYMVREFNSRESLCEFVKECILQDALIAAATGAIP